MDAVERSLAEAASAPRSTVVLSIDPDGFKAVNDGFGHHIGDLVLVAACSRLEAALRPSESLGRIGGDEFAVAMRVFEPGTASTLCQRIVEILARPFAIEGNTVTIGASVGFSGADDRTRSAVQLVRQADRAIYDAKTAGGSRHATRDVV